MIPPSAQGRSALPAVGAGAGRPAAALGGADPHSPDRYRAYRERQSAALTSLLPREAIRPLYARAREWALANGVETGKDPLATLTRFLEELLPLPPFEVWREDRVRHLDAHLEEEFRSPQARRGGTPPALVDARMIEHQGLQWKAALHLFFGEGAWRGFLSFVPLGDDGGRARVRTADIFREEGPEMIRERFRSFQPGTLRAFLRSVLP